MIEVLGRATSANVQIVMWALAELGLDYKRHDVGGAFGGTNTPEYLAMNPNGLVPVIKDGDLVLFESAAILRYLASKYGDQAFYPTDSAHRAKLDVWAEWTKSSFYPVLLQGLFYPLVRFDPAILDRDALAASAGEMKALATMLNDRLGAGPWIGGDDFSFADIVVGSLLFRYYDMEFDKADLPHLQAYYDRLSARPAYAGHVMVSYESLRWKG